MFNFYRWGGIGFRLEGVYTILSPYHQDDFPALLLTTYVFNVTNSVTHDIQIWNILTGKALYVCTYSEWMLGLAWSQSNIFEEQAKLKLFTRKESVRCMTG